MSRNAEKLLKTELSFSIIKRKKCKYLLTLKVCEVFKNEGKARIDIFFINKRSWCRQTGFYWLNYAEDLRLQYYRLVRNVLWPYYETIHKLKIDHDMYGKGKDKHSYNEAICTTTGALILTVSLLCGVCFVHLVRAERAWRVRVDPQHKPFSLK